MDHCLLSLEREGLDAEVVSAVLGPLHTLKGNSGMIGFSGIKDYVHRLEDVFAHVRDGTLVLQPEVPVQARRVMLLDYEAASPVGGVTVMRGSSGRLGGLLEVALALVCVEFLLRHAH